MMKLRLATPSHLVDLAGVADLKGIRIEGADIVIGALTTQHELVGSDLLRNGAALVGGVQTLRIWCYDRTDTLTANAANVRSVYVRIITRTESGATATDGRNQHAVMETRVRLRNL